MSSYLTRLTIFIALYCLVIFGHPPLTHVLYGYRIVYHEPYQLFLLPLLLILLTLLARHKIPRGHTYRQNWPRTGWYSVLALLLIFFRLPSALTSVGYLLMISYLTILTTLLFVLFVAVFPSAIIRRFSWELALLMPLVPTSFFLLQIVNWFSQQLATPVTLILAQLLPRIFPATIVYLDTAIIDLHGFRVAIGPTCTGLLSILTFTILFGFSILTLRQWYTLKKIPTLCAWVGGLSVVFLFNLVRVTVLIAIGAFYSSELALKLFHEFFAALIISGLFILYLYKILPYLMVKKPAL